MKKIKSTRTFLILIAILSVFAITACVPPVGAPPTVSATVPLDAATGVALNATVTAIFSVAMEPTTILATSFTLVGPAAVTGTVTYDAPSKTATFTPSANLAANTVYTATITTAVKDLAGFALAADKVWNFTTGAAADTTPPTVSSTIPIDAATGVALNAPVTAIFSEDMSPTTVVAANFTVAAGTNGVAGAVAYVALTKTITFTPTAALAASTVYTATITTGVKDIALNAMAAAKVWTFTTGTAADTTQPTVSSTVPASSATNVLVNSNITATFSEPMLASTLVSPATTFAINQDSPLTAVTGTVTYTGNTATFTPSANLAPAQPFTATITVAAKDLAGNAMAASYIWHFTTAAASLTTFPADNATSVAININGNIRAVFPADMDYTTIVGANFTVAETLTPSNAVVGTVTYDVPNKTAIFAPAANLAVNMGYTATITTNVKYVGGANLASPIVWTFTTIPLAGAGPAPVSLETAGNYAVMSAGIISNVVGSATVITGNVATQGTLSLISGFETLTPMPVGGPYIYNTSTRVASPGNVYASDMTAGGTPANLTKAGTDETTAYNDAAGRSLGAVNNLDAGLLSGTTPVFAPGLYKWTTPVSITGSITISGAADDVWIFVTTGDLTLAPAATVILGGQAKAKNIFWAVATITKLDTTAHLEGIVLSGTDVQMLAGATLNGRAYSKTTQVTLSGNTITQPTP